MVVENPLMSSEPAPDLPFAIRMVTEQVLGVAEDADLRAEILDDIMLDHKRHDSFTRRDEKGAGIDRRVKSLHEAAVDLREVAVHLVDQWRAPRHTS